MHTDYRMPFFVLTCLLGHSPLVAGAIEPLVRVVDPDAGETQQVTLHDGAVATVTLVELTEKRDSVRNPVRRAQVRVRANDRTVSLISSTYHLPTTTGHPEDDGGLILTALGKTYSPDTTRVPIRQSHGDTGGSTSVRNIDADHLQWKAQGYYQRNRDLGQVFTAEKDFRLDAIVLRTGPSDAAVKAGAPGAKVFLQFFEVVGTPRINDNSTPKGTNARHGFSTNHRCDDFLEGIRYEPLCVVTGGIFPDIPPTRDFQGRIVNGDAGKLLYIRWDLLSADEIVCKAGRRYAFMVGFEEPAAERAFTLSNRNAASSGAVPSLMDSTDMYHGGWAIRREGDGIVPPRMIPADTPPGDAGLNNTLIGGSLFVEGPDRYALSPTTDGYPDVDTYRDHEFYLEVHWPELDRR